MKGIVLAGGHGSRLFPLTRSTSKHLLPVHDKAMIFYSTSILLLAGLTEIAVVCRPQDVDAYRRNLDFLRDLGVELVFLEQPHPGGIPSGILLAEGFCGGQGAMVVLGDNLFYGAGLMDPIRAAARDNPGATIFTQKVRDPERFGVLESTPEGIPVSIIEKPTLPKSDQAVVGLYVFDSSVFSRANSLRESRRGETEVAELLTSYLSDGSLAHRELPRGTTWFDMGTFASIDTASSFVRTVEERGGEMIGSLEEVCLRMGLVDPSALLSRVETYPDSAYKSYLLKIIGSDK